MQSNWWLNLLSGLEIAILAAVAALMLARKLTARWRSLFCYVLVQLAMRLFLVYYLFYPKGHYRIYFWIYWDSTALLALLRLGMIGDIVRSFPGLDFLPNAVYWFITITGMTMAIASGTFCYHHSAAFHEAQDTVVMLNNCVFIAWTTFLVSFLASIRLFNFGWSPQGACIAFGVFLHMSAGMIVAYLLMFKQRIDIPLVTGPFLPQSNIVVQIKIRLLANLMDSCSIVVFCSWVLFVFRHSLQQVILPERNYGSIHRSIRPLPTFDSSRER